ncbi:Retrovirus-related Pol polyprotein from transposon 17.6 [Vitis vinifera]|uniref:Retrovirus-related Pol polyprotein from transposon 17.6 n=2 Tax=Vitis vinifera TaxID=29760 RepID=A0A438G904_VITVI|nr:Retrovirus-related Pol polyprotein from transposon 17.6 [Vitis vinifera]
MGEPSPLRNPLGTRGSACVEVMTTLHGSTPSLGGVQRVAYRRRSWRQIDQSIRPVRQRSDQGIWTQIVTVDQFAAAMASIQEAIASLGQRIDGQQAQQVPVQEDTQFDATVPPPPPHMPTPISEDPHARMDKLEQKLRQMRTSEGAITWEDFDGAPVASLPAKFRMPEIERYTGIGCPRIHLRLYSTVMRAHGLDDAQMVMLFPMSLSGAAQRWFASLEVSRRRTWDDLAQEFLRQFAFNTVIDVSRRELEALRQRPEESVTSFISRWREKISQIIDRPSERDQISMIMRSLQPRFARHLMGFPHTDFGSLVQALYGIEEGIARGLWSESSPTDSKGKRPSGGQRSGDTTAPSRPMTPTYLHPDSQPVFAAHVAERPPAPYTRPRAPQTTTYVQRPPRQFAQLGMPLSRAFQKLTEGGLLIPLASRPLPQPIPPRFRMDLHCSYHQGPGHDTDHCTALRHAIQDLIDQGLVNLGQPSVTTNPLPAHSTHAVHPSSGDIHHMDLIEDDSIHMLSWDDGLPSRLFHDSYEIDGVSLVPQTPAPFSLIPDEAPFQGREIQIVTRSGRIAQPPPPAVRPFEGTASHEEVRREDDEVLRQLQSTQARISIWSLLASSSTHRDALIRALSQIRVETTTTPEGLIHMMTAGRATCIVFSDDDLPPDGLDHVRPLYITVGCSGRRVPSVLLDNGSALNVCPLATAIALGFAPSDFGPSTQTVLRIPTSFNLLLGRPWIHVAGAIPSSLHQKVKFIHDGQVITHSSTVVLDMMRGMTFLPGMGLGRRQQGPSEFIAAIDHDTTFGLGFIPTEADYRHMARLRKERVRARLSHTPFDYPIRPYRMSLADYFVRGSETRPRLEEIDSVVHTDRETELQHLFHQLQLSDGAPDTSFPMAITPTSPDRASMLSLCFPEEITSDGVIVDPTEVIDGVVPHDEYRDEMDMMTVSQIAGIVQLQPVSAFDMFGVSTIEVFEGTQTLPVPELPEDDSSLFEGIVSPVEGASDLVDPPLSFDVLSGFVSRSDDVSVASFMDLSIFEYSPVSCDSISTSAPHSPITQIFDIDDEIAHPSSDRDSFDHDSGPIDERVSPAAGDVETVDFGTEDQPRELKIGSPLSTDERDRLIHLLRSYLDVFAWSYEDMPGLDPSIVQHHLPTLPHARPVKQKLRRLHPRWSLQVKEEIQKQLSVGFISVVEYPEWLANVVPVPKKDGKVRVCVDFRDLNKASPKDDFPLPHIDLLVDGTAGHSMLSFMDGFSGYNQILMAPEDMEKTAFITEWGTYCYRVMPFGLKNAGATYQRAATTLFHDMMHRDVEVYVDDMIVKSRGRADHLDALERFFERIRKFRLRLNPKKCTFGVTSGKLGHMVSERGIEVDPDKIKAILDMPAPKTEKEIRGFLGRLQYISRFIARLTDICEPIFRLLRKNQPTVWNDDCQFAFEKIKEYLLSPPVLVPPTPGRPLLLYLSVSDMALGCMLAQIDDLGKERAIYYLSKRMLEYEMKYVMIERLCLALVWATRRLRHYMTEYSVHLISRLDPLRYLFDRPALTGRLMRWLVLLTEFDIQYVSQKSIKGSIVADHLASLPTSEDRPVDDDFPDEEFVAMTSLSGWCMYFDGAANQSGYGIGVLLVSPQGDHIPRSVRLAFSDRHPATNNIVEYEACILGLETALELDIRQMEVFGDSNLVLRQIQGDWKTRDVKLRPYHAYLELLVARFDDLRYVHLPRAQNRFADALATLASSVDIPIDVVIRPLLIESRSAPAYCCLIGETEVQDDLPWYHDIYQFLRSGTYPEVATKDRRALRHLATRFVICGDTLYRRSADGMLLLCLDRASADRVMREVHSGVCGPHMGGHMLAQCQIHGDLIHAPPSELHALTSPWPFQLFHQVGGAASYARLTSARVASFIRSHIICRYGVPHELISDRGAHFRAEVDTLLQEYGIRHHRSSAYRPQTNGAVEAANKNIKRILRKMVETSRDWSEKLPFALWAYRTSFRTSTGATPYSLVYGMEAVLPVETEMGSLRVALEQQISETEWAQARFDQLNLLDERRLRAADHVQAYQRKMARAFKKRLSLDHCKKGT